MNLVTFVISASVSLIYCSPVASTIPSKITIMSNCCRLNCWFPTVNCWSPYYAEWLQAPPRRVGRTQFQNQSQSLSAQVTPTMCSGPWGGASNTAGHNASAAEKKCLSLLLRSGYFDKHATHHERIHRGPNNALHHRQQDTLVAGGRHYTYSSTVLIWILVFEHFHLLLLYTSTHYISEENNNN